MMLWPSLFLLLLPLVHPYKILVFSPTISRSHMISNGRIADELATAGHDVVLFEPDFLDIFEKVQAAKVARRWPVKGFSDALHKVLSGFSSDVFEETSILDKIRGENAYHGAYNSMCKQIIENDELMKQLRDENFDAYFGEQINLCGNGLAHALGIKVHFWISSCPVFESMAAVTGMPNPFSYVPSGGMAYYANPTYWLRAQNLFYGTVGMVVTAYGHWSTTQLYRDKFGADFPNVGTIAGNSDIIFISSDEFIDISRPEMPNMVHIGGLGLERKKKTQLDVTFEKEVQLGKKGTIYFSLGTIVNTTLLPPSVMENLAVVAKAFSDYHFIARVDSHDGHARRVAEDVPNLNVFDWVPQPALLTHPRVKLFITHSGYNGIMEAALSGVPLLTLPFMFDQSKNSQAVTQNGWGLSLDKRCLRDRPDKLIQAIRALLSDDKYKKAAERIQRLIRTKPFKATERLLKTTEFVLANGGVKELLSEGRRHSFVHYYNLDVIVPFLLLVSLCLYVLFRVTRRVFRSAPVSRSKVKTN